MPKNTSLSLEFISYREEELPTEIRKLFDAARQAASRSHSPYSQFRVGAALLVAGDVLITGANQENASFPAGICAEQVALAHRSMVYPDRRILALAVIALPQGKPEQGVSPCGICRQAMLEYELKQQAPFHVWLKTRSGNYLSIPSAANLLPLSFSGDDLPDRREA